MVRGLLYHDDCNVFVVDWSGGSRVMYPQAVTNIRVVALEIGALIKWMESEMGQRPEMVHVIGHSLGSHAAGMVYEKILFQLLSNKLLYRRKYSFLHVNKLCWQDTLATTFLDWVVSLAWTPQSLFSSTCQVPLDWTLQTQTS